MTMEKYAPYFTFIVVHISLIFLVYPENIFETANKGHWLPILIGCIVEYLLLWLYLHILVSFPRLDVIDIFYVTTTVWLSRVFFLPFVLFLLTCITLLFRSHAEIISVVLTPNTPIWVLMLFLIISLFAAVSEIPAILRACFVIASIFIPVIVFCLISSLQSAEVANILPIQPSSSFLQAPKFYSGLFAFSGFLFLGFIRPHIKIEADQKRKYLLLYVIAIVPLYFISIYFPLLVFAQETASKFTFPVIEAMETIDLYWLMFERVTIFYVTVTLCFIILYAAILIWMAALVLQKLYMPVSRNKLAIGVALVCYIGGCLIPSWTAIERLSLLDTVFRFYSIIIFPCLLGILARFLKRRESLA